jgi:hypothetical protein
MAGVTATPASAGAWPEEAGRTQVIFGLESSGARSRFGPRPHGPRAGRFSKGFQSLAVFHGLTDGWTAVAIQRAELSRVRSRNDAGGSLEAGVQARLWQEGGTVLSVQVTGRIGGDATRAADLPLRWRSAGALEGRVLLGHGLSLGSRPAFVEAQIGYRQGFGALRSAAFLDLTAGYRPADAWLLLLQSFNTLEWRRPGAFARLNGETGTRLHKVRASVVLEHWQPWSIQFGAETTVAGRNTPREWSGLIAVWYRF